MTENDNRHYLKVAASILDASCTGQYMGITVENVFLNVRVSGQTYGKHAEKSFTLARVLFSNLWYHRIPIDQYGMIKLIDSQGMQHRHEPDIYSYMHSSQVLIAENRSAPYVFEEVAQVLEGRSKTRGWLWFPALPQGMYPHRLVFRFHIFAPGSTCGRVQDSETLEIIFDFSFDALIAIEQRLDMPKLKDVS